jgi:DNA-binding NarL/FixJ family response regulator
MSLAISGSFASLFSTTAAVSASGAAAVQKPQPVTTNNAYTVRLTEAEQVDQLYSQGHTVPQIAFNLDLTAQAVDKYLNISING